MEGQRAKNSQDIPREHQSTGHAPLDIKTFCKTIVIKIEWK